MYDHRRAHAWKNLDQLGKWQNNNNNNKKKRLFPILKEQTDYLQTEAESSEWEQAVSCRDILEDNF